MRDQTAQSPERSERRGTTEGKVTGQVGREGMQNLVGGKEEKRTLI